MRYLDTGSRDPSETIYTWLEQRLPRAVYFACQTGYFGQDGLRPFEDEVRAILAGGGELHLVIGSNDGGVLSADLTYVLDLIEGHGARGTLHLVGAADVLMHPKTFYVETADSERHALVGSANLTARGLAGNIEAALAVNSATDRDAPFDEIRDAVLAWLEPDRPNAVLVTRDNLAELTSAGAADVVPARPPRASQDDERRRRWFPPLGRLLPGRSQTSVAAAEEAAESAQAAGGVFLLPGGAVGIVKILSSLDTKAFRGAPGTPYIALPRDIAALLPMVPAGINDEPRVDVDLVALVDSLPGQVFHHRQTRGNTNITYVGIGTTIRSHPDLRLNFLQPIARGVRNAAAVAGVPVPRDGDALTMEFLSPTSVRMRFVTQNPLRDRLRGLAMAGEDAWAWLSPVDVPAI